MAGPDEVVQFARSKGLAVKLLADLGSVRTVFEAVQRTQRSPAEIGKTVLLTVKGDPVLVIVPGDRTVDGAKVGEAFGASAREVSLATQAEARRITGYDIGTIPPFGHVVATPVLLDVHVVLCETVLLPAGSPDALIEVRSRALARMPNTRLGTWSVPLEPATPGAP